MVRFIMDNMFTKVVFNMTKLHFIAATAGQLPTLLSLVTNKMFPGREKVNFCSKLRQGQDDTFQPLV